MSKFSMASWVALITGAVLGMWAIGWLFFEATKTF